MRFGFASRAAGIDPGDHSFRPGFTGVVHVWNICEQRIGPYPPRVAFAHRTLANQQSATFGWGFHTVPGGIDTGDHRCDAGCAGVLNSWRDLSSGDGAVSSRNAPGSTNPSQSAIRQWG